MYQKKGKETKVVGFASKTLSPAEKNYRMHSGKLEFLALKWSICDKFSDYLIHDPTFEVVTDNNPLTYILTTAKLNATCLRWINQLANFHFSIKYRCRKKHTDADYLSRHPIREIERIESKCDNRLGGEDVKAAFTGVSQGDCCVRHVSVDMMEVKDVAEKMKIDRRKLKEEQKKDPVISPVYDIVKSGLR